jgi:S1-C subfamily serine protease
MRPKLGMSLSDNTSMLSNPLEFGPGGVGVAERSPKIAGITGGSPAAQAGLKVGERVYRVDGKAVDSVHDFEVAMDGKTTPGEVVLHVGPTKMDARDVRIVFNK